MKLRDFRLLALSTFFENVTRGENVVLGWVILELTDSPFMVGLAVGIRHAPAFFLGITAGTISDLIDRRTLIRVLMATATLVAFLMGLLLASGKAELWHLLLIPAVGGTIHMMLHTINRSFVFDLVGQENGLLGMSYLGLAMRSGGMIGALAVGFTLGKWGAGAGYFAISIGCGCAFFFFSLIKSSGDSAPSRRGSLANGFSELWEELKRNRTLSALVLIVMLVELLGFTSNALMPSIARDIWNMGPEGLGILDAFSSAGGIIAIALVSMLGQTDRQGVRFIIVLHVFGIALLLLGLAPSVHIAIFAIVVMSGMMALSDLFSQTLLQRLVPNDLRGRAMGAWTTAVGTAPLGSLEIGALASIFGVTTALSLHGGALILLAIVTLVTFKKLRKL